MPGQSQIRRGRATDARGLNLRIDGLEIGKDPDAGIALRDPGEGVSQSERRPCSSPISRASEAFSCWSLALRERSVVWETVM